MGLPIGTIVRFDDIRGYGFIAPADGGDDLFVHANDLLVDKSLYKAGTHVEFTACRGDRGLKATAVHLVGPPNSTVERVVPADVDSADDSLCDVLSADEFTREVTEILLGEIPDLNAGHILQLRELLLKLADGHGWLDT